jgi:hypothetical protein
MAQATPEQLAESSVEPKPRPTQPIFFHGCRGLRIEDVTIRRSPCWTLSLSTCDDVRVRGISILNDLCVPNSDGVHLSACRDVIVSDCVLSCGDDCVAITGITNWDRFCERIIVHDCVMVSRSAGVRIGHLASKVRQVLLSNLVITDSQRGIGVFAGKGGIVENVQATNLTIDTRIVAGHWWGKGEPMVVSAHDGGKIRNVRFSGVRARSENGIVVCGGNGEASRIELDDIRLDLAYGRNRPLLGKWIDLQPAPLRPAPDAERHIPWIWADNVRDLTLHRIRYGRARSESQGFGVDGVLNDIRELSMADVAEG